MKKIFWQEIGKESAGDGRWGQMALIFQLALPQMGNYLRKSDCPPENQLSLPWTQTF